MEISVFASASSFPSVSYSAHCMTVTSRGHSDSRVRISRSAMAFKFSCFPVTGSIMENMPKDIPHIFFTRMVRVKVSFSPEVSSMVSSSVEEASVSPEAAVTGDSSHCADGRSPEGRSGRSSGPQPQNNVSNKSGTVSPNCKKRFFVILFS